MRAVFHEVRKKGFISNTAVLTDPLANEFYGWAKEQHETGKINSLAWDICSVRGEFYNSRAQFTRHAAARQSVLHTPPAIRPHRKNKENWNLRRRNNQEKPRRPHRERSYFQELKVESQSVEE